MKSYAPSALQDAIAPYGAVPTGEQIAARIRRFKPAMNALTDEQRQESLAAAFLLLREAADRHRDALRG